MFASFTNSLPSISLAAVDQKAVAPFEVAPYLTNSVVVSLMVLAFLLVVAKMVSKNLKTVPTGAQNLAELAIEKLYAFVEGIVGKKIAPKAFPLLATIFFFFLFANWFGLLPGVGTVGTGYTAADCSFHVTKPLLRPTAADLNAGLGIAFVFMFVWLWISIKEMGIGGFFSHMFGAKGKSANPFMNSFLIAVFFGVGLLEVVSIAIRPVSLSLRIYGNIFAGENLLHSMGHLGYELGLHKVIAFIMNCLVPVPFYFLEILVGFLQAVVFTLLCAVYIQLSTTHDESH